MHPLHRHKYGGAIKPGIRATINKSHPLAAQLRGFWLCGGPGTHAIDAVKDVPASRVGTPGDKDTIWGVASDVGAGNVFTLIPEETSPSTYKPTLPMTVAVGLVPDSLTSHTFPFVNDFGNTRARGIFIRIETTGHISVGIADGSSSFSTGTIRAFRSSGSEAAVGVPLIISGSIRGNTDGDVYANGKRIAQALQGTGAGLAYAGGAGRIGGPLDVTTVSFDGGIAWCALWARSLDGEEHRILADNPYDLFNRSLSVFIPHEVLVFNYTDSDTEYLKLTPSATGTGPTSDAATARVSLTPTTVVETLEKVDAATAKITFTPSEYQTVGTLDFKLTPRLFTGGTDEATAEVLLTPLGGIEYVDTESVPLKLTPDGSDIYQPYVPQPWFDEGTVKVFLTPSAITVKESVDSETEYLRFFPRAVFATEDTGTLVLALKPITAREFRILFDPDLVAFVGTRYVAVMGKVAAADDPTHVVANEVFFATLSTRYVVTRFY